MTKLTIKIHNVETGEVIERQMTADELAQQSKDEADAKIKGAAKAAAEAAKSAAQAKLAALGLTTDDLKALGL